MLLDRIAACGAEGRRGRYEATAHADPEALMASIRRQLARLLNCQQGMCEAQPDYGLPALAELFVGRDDDLRRVADAIRATIEKYEPRLRRVRVTRSADAAERQTGAFRVEAVMIGSSGDYSVWYETALTPGGKVDVAG